MPSATWSTCGRTRPMSSADATGGSRCSRTGARPWAPRTRIRTARSGRARRCRTRAREDAAQRTHLAPTGRRPARDYVDHESGERVVAESEDWLAVVPFWAAWPFETLLIPKRPAARLSELREPARDDLAAILRRPARAVRRALQALLPVLDGLAPGAVWRGSDRRLAGTRPLLPAAALRQGSASSWSATSCSRRRSAT